MLFLAQHAIIKEDEGLFFTLKTAIWHEWNLPLETTSDLIDMLFGIIQLMVQWMVQSIAFGSDFISICLIVPKYLAEIKSALIKIMDWHQTGDKPLSEPMKTCFSDAHVPHSASMSSTHEWGRFLSTSIIWVAKDSDMQIYPYILWK